MRWKVGFSGHHPQRGAQLLELAGDLVELAQVAGQRGGGPLELVRLTHHRLGDHELPDHVDQAVHPLRVDLHRLAQYDIAGGRGIAARRGSDAAARHGGRRGLRGDGGARGRRSGLPAARRGRRRLPDGARGPGGRSRSGGRSGVLRGGDAHRRRRDPLEEPLERRGGRRERSSGQATAEAGDEALHGVHRLEGDVEGGALHGQGALPRTVEEPFGLVGQGGDVAQPQEAGVALDRVEGPEEGVQGLLVAALLLEREQVMVQCLQVLDRFGDEVPQELHGEGRVQHPAAVPTRRSLAVPPTGIPGVGGLRLQLGRQGHLRLGPAVPDDRLEAADGGPHHSEGGPRFTGLLQHHQLHQVGGGGAGVRQPGAGDALQLPACLLEEGVESGQPRRVAGVGHPPPRRRGDRGGR